MMSEKEGVRIELLDLLDLLAAGSGCIYLSDLRWPYMKRTTAQWLAHRVRFLPPEGYPLAQWKEAFRYMTGREPTGNTEAACREELLDAMEYVAEHGGE